MRKVLLSFSLFYLGFSMLIGANVPHAVKAEFAEHYSSKIEPVWTIENNRFVALFQDREGMKMAYFTKEAIWEETKLFQIKKDLPEQIQAQLLYEEKDGTLLFCGKVYDNTGASYLMEQQKQDLVVVKTFRNVGEQWEKEVVIYKIQTVEASSSNGQWSIDLLPTMNFNVERKP